VPPRPTTSRKPAPPDPPDTGVRDAITWSLCDHSEQVSSRGVTRSRTQVAIIGAGPAGLLLGQLLYRQGIDAVILEARSREYVEARIRAGVLEQGTIEVLREAGVGERMDREGLPHGGIYINYDGQRHHIPMTELTGGRQVMIYGQTEVVKDLIAARLAAGAPLHFDCADVAVSGLTTDTPTVTYTAGDGTEHELAADLIAGTDGFHGICRPAIPDPILQTWGREYPFAWLGILADVAPSTDELIYAQHERGFALHSMRSPTVSRLYIQVPPTEKIEDWSDDRIWSELHTRLATDGWELTEGPVTEKSITPMRSFVAAPMRHGRLFLAGDAAHIVPPTGAKGLNLAVADVTVLAEAMIAHFTHRADGGLHEYSDRCTTRVWRAQHFSWWMTTMLHQDPEADAYALALQRSQLRYTCSSEAAMTSLAENYVGLPLAETTLVHG
jgi:p-hydroxybenzoate 3-monooxygenase